MEKGTGMRSLVPPMAKAAVAVGAEEVEVVVADVNPAFVLGNGSVLEAHPRVPWIEVHLADGGGVVALLVEHLGPGADAAFSQVGAQPLAIAGHAVLDGVEAGEQRGASRHADGRSGVGTLVADAALGQAVDVGSIDEGSSIGVEKIGTKLVGHDEEDVGTGHGGFPVGCRT